MQPSEHLLDVLVWLTGCCIHSQVYLLPETLVIPLGTSVIPCCHFFSKSIWSHLWMPFGFFMVLSGVKQLTVTILSILEDAATGVTAKIRDSGDRLGGWVWTRGVWHSKCIVDHTARDREYASILVHYGWRTSFSPQDELVFQQVEA